ncbi:hypothetical protein A2943_00150 [Candidatus Adlerbacteria bacterium RIFCSPLOWO2_01_FULL_51_16]|uniref:Glycosyl transferase family 1 domain-containing protein n=1 Tax=Candidatus Adlerbacteria bacterium RIFCSPLOWO2_01_FULL_51_16 TaxID=1797243 RepID=A0A1F4XFB2_9BACT|nr:MAG: hypothetical protein A2943_00150 [Candidatus Adlerbacteria bacterium RIFCSPLOWO2_01_FULL_51_16]
MRLLVCTQTVDRNDPDLGFFHRWLEEFAKHCEKVVVICLQEGEHALPKNVEVHSLGKEKGTPRLMRWIRALRYIVVLRKQHDAVFVHMSPEYVVLGGIFWRLWNKKIVLWYTHKSVTLALRIATLLAHAVATASKESFRLKSKKVTVLGHGIDTDFFTSDPNTVRGDAILSVGRLSPSKRHDLAIRAAVLADRELYIIGEGPERKILESLVQSIKPRVHFLGGLTQGQLRDEYRKASFLIHTSETGSLDKVVLEALATDVAVVTTSDVYRDYPVQIVPATPEAIAKELKVERESRDRTTIVKERHSLVRLVPKILGLYV